ncbi:hypothetical protein AB6A40_006712 [Gnathostoma spinigerum]|uniref:Retinol dehydrogenase 12 n=1 Tax=Gnathostoma spinigerum TaxID=75299 RepID=A0ABD6EJ48_9BILA
MNGGRSVIYNRNFANVILTGFLLGRNSIAISIYNMNGKVVVITGANCGLGLHTAKALQAKGARVVMGCRSMERGEAAALEIHKKYPETEKPLVLQIDLSVLSSVEQFVEEFRARFRHLDVLINNAGIMSRDHLMSKGGVELNFAVNHLGHFHLTNLLLPSLESSCDGRIIIISSGLYRKVNAVPNIERLTNAKEPVENPYCVSKLANCLHTVALKRFLTTNSQVSVYAIRPGFVPGTELGRSTSWYLRKLAMPLMWMVGRSLDQGIQSTVHCATKPLAELQSGSLYNLCEVEEYTSAVTKKSAEELWSLSERLIKFAQNKEAHCLNTPVS